MHAPYSLYSVKQFTYRFWQECGLTNQTGMKSHLQWYVRPTRVEFVLVATKRKGQVATQLPLTVLSWDYMTWLDIYILLPGCYLTQSQGLSTQFHSVGEQPLLVSTSPSAELNFSSAKFNTSCGWVVIWCLCIIPYLHCCVRCNHFL